MGKTKISWADYSWSPLRARVKDNAADIAREKGYESLVRIATKMRGRVGPHCEKVSGGCANCYSASNNCRCLPHNGTGLPFDRRSRDLVDMFLDEKILLQPLRWNYPRTVFVCSQTDLFGEFATDEMIDRVFAVMALCPRHKFMVLTKRSARLLAYFTDDSVWVRIGAAAKILSEQVVPFALPSERIFEARGIARGEAWTIHARPLPHVQIGISCEDQETYDARSAQLMMTPAAVHWVSYEPGLGPIDFRFGDTGIRPNLVIMGGESGANARHYNLDWPRSAIEQCQLASVGAYVKQLGAKPYEDKGEGFFSHCPGHSRFNYLKLKSRSGADVSEWPDDLRVREAAKGTTA